ncbi:REP-associated tyrosine transposase [Haloferula sp. A504]|uniref:REP-associated tyrosine transposase n=1 Tax=Haloferula sp. A504 TaxID=3373601 RepID=UPI00378A83E6
MDRGHGECLFGNEELAAVMAECLGHFDGERYDLLAWCVMPNHVHAVLRPKEGHELERILHTWKSFTAHELNRRLGREAELWQKESYDHLVRDTADLRAQVKYVLANPVKAGLHGWKWVGTVYEELAAGRRNHGLPRAGAATSLTPTYDPFSYERRRSEVVEVMGHELGGDREIRVFTSQEKWNAVAHKIAKMGDYKPEIVLEKSGVVAVDPRDEEAIAGINRSETPKLVTVADGLEMETIHAFRMLAFRLDARHPILLKDTLQPAKESGDFVETLLVASRVIGSLICDGIGDAILVQGEPAPGQSLRLSYNILQASGARIFKTDYVACPSCGRTLFNLQTTTQKIREATGHLKGVRIAVMGCIVNGPGEMADADFGYVGGAPGKINLYVGKQAVKFNIPAEEAVDRLVDLIREHGKWIDAPAEQPAEV